MIGSRSINGIGQGGLEHEHEHFGTVKTTIPQATLELLLHMGNVNGQFRGTINIKYQREVTASLRNSNHMDNHSC